jgi:hypothetical protein
MKFKPTNPKENTMKTQLNTTYVKLTTLVVALAPLAALGGVIRHL